MTPLAALCAIALVAPSPRPAALQLPPLHRHRLANGISVLLMEYRRAPTISLVVTLPGGTAADPMGQSGLAAMTAELMRRGTAKRSAEALAEEIEYLGASIDLGAGRDRVEASLSALSRDTGAALDLLADVLRNPTFAAEEIERSRKLALAGLQGLLEDPGRIADRAGRREAYGTHPYGSSPGEASLSGITRGDVEACYQRSVRPQAITIVAVGGFRTADMLKMLSSRFGDWQPPAATGHPNSRPEAPFRPRQVLVVKADATQSQVRVVRPALKRLSPEYMAARVADSILAGGFTSRLIEEIRVNRSLTYSIGGGFSAGLAGGDFTIATFTKVQTTRAMLSALRGELAKAAAKGFTANELKRVKGYLVGIFAISAQTPDSLASQLADAAALGLPDDYVRRYPERLARVTLAHVNAVAKRYMDPRTMSVVVVGPEAARGQMAKTGPVETVRFEDLVR